MTNNKSDKIKEVVVQAQERYSLGWIPPEFRLTSYPIQNFINKQPSCKKINPIIERLRRINGTENLIKILLERQEDL